MMVVNKNRSLMRNRLVDEPMQTQNLETHTFGKIPTTGYEVEYVDDKRGFINPIPENLDKMLSRLQMNRLLELKNIGWRLCFVRRSCNKTALPVLFNPENDHKVIILFDGKLCMHHSFQFRTISSIHA